MEKYLTNIDVRQAKNTWGLNKRRMTMEILNGPYRDFNAFPSIYQLCNTKQQYFLVTGIAFFSHIKQDFFLAFKMGLRDIFL